MSIFITDDSLTGLTPAHTYRSTTDFNAILKDIARDYVPTGTGKIFPTVWKEDFEENELGLKMAGNSTPTYGIPGDINYDYSGQIGGFGNGYPKW
jgi:hypothetical protein